MPVWHPLHTHITGKLTYFCLSALYCWVQSSNSFWFISIKSFRALYINPWIVLQQQNQHIYTYCRRRQVQSVCVCVHVCVCSCAYAYACISVNVCMQALLTISLHDTMRRILWVPDYMWTYISVRTFPVSLEAECLPLLLPNILGIRTSFRRQG